MSPLQIIKNLIGVNGVNVGNVKQKDVIFGDGNMMDGEEELINPKKNVLVESGPNQRLFHGQLKHRVDGIEQDHIVGDKLVKHREDV